MKPSCSGWAAALAGRLGAALLRLAVRGALLAFAGSRGIPVLDYPPATVKLTVAGVGNASKAAVASAVEGSLGGDHPAGDATDALAVALCHLRHGKLAGRVVEVGPRRGRISQAAARLPAGARFVRVSR